MLLLNKGKHDGRHTAQHHIFPEILQHHIILRFGQRCQRKHVLVHGFNLGSLVTLGPQKFLKIQREHFNIFLGTNAVGFNLFVVDTHERTGTNYIIATI